MIEMFDVWRLYSSRYTNIQGCWLGGFGANEPENGNIPSLPLETFQIMLGNK